MSRIERLENEIKKLRFEAVSQTNGRKSKEFKLPFKAKNILKKARKSPEYIVTQYLTQKKDIRFKLCRVVSGNIIIVNNKVHKINPKYLWRYGKNFWYIHREIDREPVSNEDYETLKQYHRDTDADVPLIKAVLGAVNKPGKPINKKIGIILLGALVIGAIVFALF